MKRYLFILTLFFIHHTYAQLAPIGTTWVYEGYASGNTPQPEISKVVYTISKDSLIGGTVYSEIAHSGYMTNDSGRIYYTSHSEKFLLFDFNAKPGDTIYVDCWLQIDSIIRHFPIKVERVYYLITPQQDRLLQFDFSTLIDSWVGPVGTKNTITEKLIFGPAYSHGVCFCPVLFQRTFEFSEVFKCYHEPNGISVEYVPDCDKVGIAETEALRNEVKIYPNPASMKLNIDSKNSRTDQMQISLYDVLGELRKEMVLTQVNNQIDISDLPAGVYYCLIRNDSLRIGQYSKVFISRP